MDKFKALEIFHAVVSSGSYAKAAASYNASPSTISKAITRLEEDLGLQLFQRNTRNLKLTAQGEHYALETQHILDQLKRCEFSLKEINDVAEGKLKLNLPVSYGRLYIQPLIQKFRLLYPAIDFEISYSDKYVDIIQEGVDVSIRSGTIQDSRLVVRQLSPIDFLICASSAYLKKRGKPKSVREFNKHNWIRFRFSQTGKLMPIIMPGRSAVREYHPGEQFIVDDGEALSALCADGLGITQMPHFIARDVLEQKQVKQLFPAFNPPGYGVYVVYPKRHYLPERVRCFVDFLCREIEAMGETPGSTWAK